MFTVNSQLQRFFKIIDATMSDSNKFRHSFGNGVLYTICEDEEPHKWGKEEILADKIWLIGRSYAASPERRYTFNFPEEMSEKKKNDLRDETYRGDGTGDIFIEIAFNLLGKPIDKKYCDIAPDDYSTFIKKLKQLKPYSFDCGEEDIKQLKICVGAVAEFNTLLKKALQGFDKRNNADIYNLLRYREHISFSSKFLHFHCPNSVFIYDHYTREGATTLVTGNRRRDWQYSELSISQELRDSFSKVHQKVKSLWSTQDSALESVNVIEDSIDDYKLHCIREYALCCLWRAYKGGDNLPSGCKSLPRLADSICQRIQKKN